MNPELQSAPVGPPETVAGSRRKTRVCVVGSVNEDIVVTVSELPTAGQTVRGKSISLLPGGKGANQAVAAARAGADVVFVGAVGADDAGRRSLDALRDEGVDVSAVLVHDSEPTGTAVVTVAGNGENQITIVGGANESLGADHVQQAMTRLDVGAGDVCLICFEITDEAVAVAATFARAAGATLLVNPAPARPLVDEVVTAAPILLPNVSEAEILSGAGGGSAAKQLHKMTGAPVIITLGSDGVLIMDDSPPRTVPAHKVDVVDTTGAGDTFAGVLAAALAQELPLESAVEHAVAAAGLSVTVAGAREGSPRYERIVEAMRSTA